MASTQAKQIQALVGQVKSAVSKAEMDLEAALQERENIIALPIQKQQIKDDFAYAVDTSSAKFEETLNSMIAARARKRDATGIKKSPDVMRKQGNYNELNIEAINYFLGSVIKDLTNQKIDEVSFLSDGVDDAEFEQLLETVEIKIDKLKIARDEVVGELQSILR